LYLHGKIEKFTAETNTFLLFISQKVFLERKEDLAERLTGSISPAEWAQKKRNPGKIQTSPGKPIHEAGRSVIEPKVQAQPRKGGVIKGQSV